MSTLARVVRSDAATAILTFRPDELGNSAPRVTGSLAFQFPVIDASEMRTPKIAHGTHHQHIFPEVKELPATPVIHDHDGSAVEVAMREKAIQETRAAVEAEMNAKTGSLRDELTQTIGRISGLAKELAEKLEAEVVELALEIAKKVVAREVSIEPEVVVSVTKRALAKLHPRTFATLHLHPDELAYVQDNRSKLNFHGSLELVEDASVTPGGCFIHTDNGDIDGRIQSQFDEITDGLLGDRSA